MHESESSPSHSVLESKSSHKSLNLAHESDSSPSPGLESTTTLDRIFNCYAFKIFRMSAVAASLCSGCNTKLHGALNCVGSK